MRTIKPKNKARMPNSNSNGKDFMEMEANMKIKSLMN